MTHQVQEHFKQAMSRFGTGVCVMTYKKPDTGAVEGVTISAFSSLSLDPVKILFCLGRDGQCHQDFKAVSEFTVNILSAGQKDLCYQFAGKNRDGIDAHLTDLDGVPALTNTLASIVCDTGNMHPEGDHDIIVGNVRHVEVSDDEALQPLLYYRSAIIEDYQHPA
ncbi:MAG: flavin reductase [Gammaproteobacteria bacterium]|nr:MAG: flavin reductase [Gammaproteobacteria bacterium]